MKYPLIFLWLACACLEISWAQEVAPVFSLSQNPFLGGRISGKPVDSDLPLSLQQAIDRGLEYNLGLFVSTQQARAARASRLESLSDLLPKIRGRVTESVQQINLAAFGFPPNPQIPSILGPFTVFDVRASLSMNILDLNAIYSLQEDSMRATAADFRVRDARDLVVLIVSNLYLQASANDSRVQAAESQVKTAEALYKQATDMKQAGMIAGIDVLRAQVEVEARQQQLLRARAEREKQKLTLARAIGLPMSQTFHLSDTIHEVPEIPITLDEAIKTAYNTRGDYLAAVAEAQAAERAKKAAVSKYFPSLMLEGDFGALGTTPPTSHSTYSLLAGLRIPIFEGGKTRSDTLRADAELETRQAQLEDLRLQIEQQVRTAFLELKATHDEVEVSKRGLDLAQQQMQQAQDRFAAGVADHLEVVQAQEALAVANENYISSVFAASTAQALMARATGGAEATARMILGGKP